MPAFRDRIIQSVADSACKRVAAAAIRGLQQHPATLSGDDSALATVWDEFCVQVQQGESFFWDAYALIAEQIIEAELDKLPRHEIEAIWLQTDAGRDWLYDADDDDTASHVNIPCNAIEAMEYVVSSYLMPLAEEFSNAEIEAYVENNQKARHELDSLPNNNPDGST